MLRNMRSLLEGRKRVMIYLITDITSGCNFTTLRAVIIVSYSSSFNNIAGSKEDLSGLDELFDSSPTDVIPPSIERKGQVYIRSGKACDGETVTA